MTLRLNNPIWDKAKRANIFSKVVFEIGTEAVRDIQKNIDDSVPAGKTYRRSRILRNASSRNNVKGLTLTNKNGKAARIVGYKFHKASAFGQSPAKDTKRLYRNNKIRRMAAFRIRVYNDTPYAKHLEPPARLNRPFFYSVIRKNAVKYKGMVRKALLRTAA